MFYYKICFVIVLMLSDVCFSPRKSAEEKKRIDEKKEQERKNNIERCLGEMRKEFGSTTMAIDCIRKAILYMKLYGHFAFKYAEHVTKYYDWFHLYVYYDQIKLPDEFCNNDPTCLNEISIFQDPPTHQDILSDFTPDELKLLDNVVSNVKTPEESFESSSSHQGSLTNIIKLKNNVLKNALYHHVINRLSSDIIIPYEAKPYFHRPGTNGYEYLYHISKVVKTVSAEEKEQKRKDNLERCLKEVRQEFGSCSMAISCIKREILYMKLHGKFAFTYFEHVKMYYEYSHLFIRYEDILLPDEFCNNNQSCLDDISIFLETPTFENILDDFTPDELKLLNDTISHVKIPEVSFEPSSSRSLTDTIKLKSNVLKNALYYHVINRLPRGMTIPYEAKPYFHLPGTHGWEYLHHIAKNVETISDDIFFPALFCQEVYKKPEKKKKTRNVDKNKNVIEYESELEDEDKNDDDDDES